MGLEPDEEGITETIKLMRCAEIIEKLAPKECPKNYEVHYGDGDYYCRFCGGDEIGPDFLHKPDCAWVEARKLLEEL